MIQQPNPRALCLAVSFCFCVGCGSEPEGVGVDPDVRQAVEKFFEAFTSPVQGDNRLPSVEDAYTQLHEEARKKEKLADFNRRWTKWVESQGPGWVTTAEIAEVETMPDAVVVVVNVTLGDPIDPEMVTQGSPLQLTLRKNGSTWAVYSIDE